MKPTDNNNGACFPTFLNKKKIMSFWRGLARKSTPLSFSRMKQGWESNKLKFCNLSEELSPQIN